MYLSRNTIREFLKVVEWATLPSFIILKNGSYTNIDVMPIRIELPRMAALGQIKRLKHPTGLGRVRVEAVYADINSKKYDVGSGNIFDHNNCLRNCLARILHDHPDARIYIKNDKDADAIVLIGEDKFYIEMERKDDFEEIGEKIEKHYSDEGAYRVIFFFATRYSTETEEAHVKKLFETMKKIKYQKPGRILVACYTEYITNGKLYNRKKEEVEL